MEKLVLQFLGRFSVSKNNAAINSFESSKVRGLLAYLVVEADRSYSREVLASLLWPDWPESAARSNLRYALADLRKVIGDPYAEPPFLLISRDTIQFNRASNHSLDIDEFMKLAANPIKAETLEERIPRLERALSLYTGAFLEGFSVPDSAPFENWIRRKREEYHRQCLQVLCALATGYEQQGNVTRALQYARQQVEIEPWQEEAQRQLIQLLALDGQRTAALAQYLACQRVLAQELQVEPSNETKRLCERIRDGTRYRAPGEPAPEEQLPPAPGESPFMGLQYFDESDANLFFGREALVARIVERLAQMQDGRFLAVVGASGSGKSSLVRAGVIPAIRKAGGETRTRSARDWLVHVITPTEHPLEALATSLTRESESVSVTSALFDAMRKDPRSLTLYARRLLQVKNAPRLLLVVDQFEELFTLCRSEAEREAFIANVLRAAGMEAGEPIGGAEDGPITVLIALRADFYNHCAQYNSLRSALSAHQEYIGLMSSEELRRAIEEPARRNNWEFEPGLVDLIFREIGDEPGSLPLLSHALLETWQRRRGRVMTLKGYTETGGIHSAIAKTAESVYTGMAPEKRAQMQRIFLRLTELGEGTQDTRRRASIDELAISAAEVGQLEQVLNTLVEARLVTAEEATVEVAHEALIREWPRLRNWLATGREGLRLHRHITEAARAWVKMNRDPGELYRGARLAQALEWAKGNPQELNEQEQSFLNASKSLAEQEAAEKEAARQRELEAAQKLAETERQRAEEQAVYAKRQRKRAVYLSLALAAAVIMIGVAAWFAKLSGDNARRASQNMARAQDEANTRATAEAVANDKAQLAFSRELAAASVSNLPLDPQRSLLLAMQAVKTYDTSQAENALHQAIEGNRLRASVAFTDKELTMDVGLYGVSMSPDGRQVAAASQDGYIYIASMDVSGNNIDRATIHAIPNPLDTIPGIYTSGYELEFSPDGRWLVSLADQQSAKVWEVASGRLVHTLTDHCGDVSAVAYSPDGRLIATGCYGLEPAVKIWEAATGKELQTLTGYGDDGIITAIVFSANGKRLVASSYNWIVKAWEIRPAAENPYQMEEIFTVPFSASYLKERLANGEAMLALGINQDGTRLALGANKNILLYDIEHASAASAPVLLMNIFPDDFFINKIAFNPSGDRMYSCGADGDAKVYDAATGQELMNLVGNPSGASSFALNPQYTRLLVSSYNGLLNVWDIDPAGNQEWMYLQGNEKLAKMSSDGMLYLIGRSASDTETKLEFWNLNPAGLSEAPAREIVLPLVQLDALDALAVTVNDDLTRLVNLRDDETARVTNAELWDIVTGKMIKSFPVFQSPYDSGPMAKPGVNLFWIGNFSPDGKQFTISGQWGTVDLWDLETGKKVREFPRIGGPYLMHLFSPDGSLLAISGTSENVARVWDTNSGDLMMEFKGHTDGISCVNFSPDGKRLISGSYDRTVRIWDVRTGKELLALPRQSTPVILCSFSPDGRYITTGLMDISTKIWDAASGKELLTFKGIYGEITPDGKRLITGDNWTYRGYYLDINDLMAKARSRLIRTWTQEECVTFLHTGTCPAAP